MAGNNHVTADEIARAKEIDLLTWLRRYEPDELVRRGSEFRTRTHDSLVISNGLWNWHSRGIGGKTALDYLIHVRGMDFVEAVQMLCEHEPAPLSWGGQGKTKSGPNPKPDLKPLALPERNASDALVTSYLLGRGIDFAVISRCLENGTLYESSLHHNAVFVGMDESGAPRYAMLRATNGSDFKQEAAGSEKRYAFSMRGTGTSDALVVTESAIDALSVATLMMRNGQRWRGFHYLSLGGVASSRNSLPVALERYLADHPNIERIRLMLDNDDAGRVAAISIRDNLDKRFKVEIAFPVNGKDFNDEARAMLATNSVRSKKAQSKGEAR